MQTKYQYIAQEIREKIQTNEYKQNETIPSELQLTIDYQVSRHTVRQAIALLVNEGYLRKEKGSGTYVESPKQLDAPLPSKTIGVITTYVSDYIFPSIIRGIEQTLSEEGFSLLLSSTNNDYAQERKCLENMLTQNVKGIIIEPTKSNQYNPNLGLYSQIKNAGIPIVMINASYEELDVPVVALEDKAGGYLATELLIKKACKQLLLVTKIDDLQGKYRMKGFIKALEDYHLAFDQTNIFTYTTETKATITTDLVTRLNETTFDGIVCYNDEIAYALLNFLDEEYPEMIPHLKVIGYDDSSLSQLGQHPFSSVTHPKENLGMDAAHLLIDLIHEKAQYSRILYPPQIIDRT